MATTIVAAAANRDLDTGSYLELATRAARTCVERAEVGLDEIGMLVNAGVFRDSNISEPAVAALLQKRIGLGLSYAPGRTPVFSFDLMHGASGLLHAIATADAVLATGMVKYALLVAGDTHPSTERDVADFPYSASGAALLLATAPAGGFGRLHTRDTTGPADPIAWVALDEAGADGRNAMCVRTGAEDRVDAAAAVVRACLAEEGLDGGHFAAGQALLLVPDAAAGFRVRLAGALSLPEWSVVGFDASVGDPYTAGPVHAYLHALDGGFDPDTTMVFLTVDEASAACIAYKPRPAPHKECLAADTGTAASSGAEPDALVRR
ncbi:hypothetical protein [Nocardia sputorum]|uniref:Beta-ketoacyl-[acyl-carrier-protein] synthase III N-terminal domain-containing protein n=1 Tax=Nocardia sputorum TaxID=2984338 RepID=A0ABM8CW12_9NOCA|nr:hypothetical protein [Nocardia sputorum]BDT90550.1 hypothetical protein IFM12275_05260 [Nocardia sputorum]BDT99168.1 hypothetical protein IFM12276_21970 [Nocardia sputorum]